MNEPFGNTYEDDVRAGAYSQLEFPGTYYLAFRDIPEILTSYIDGTTALDFGCGTGRSTRFLTDHGFDVVAANHRRIRRRSHSRISTTTASPGSS
jgi:SAM-dependent methyltransferase